MNDLIKKIQDALTPDLLSKEWRNQWTPSNPLLGHCYVAAEALYHLLGGKEAGLIPYVARDPEGGTHWWLQKGSEILDPTADQYRVEGCEPPYHLGRGAGFLTRNPSKRAALVLSRISN